MGRRSTTPVSVQASRPSGNSRVEGGKSTQVVTNPPDSIRWLAIARNGSDLVYECDDRIGVTLCERRLLSPRLRSSAAPMSAARTPPMPPTPAATSASTNSLRTVSAWPFVVRGDIFVVTIEKGGEAKRLTDNPTRDGDMAWSPDGKTLVYSSNRDGGFRLYTVNIATKETRPLTQGSATDTTPNFSPDGKWIAFRRGPRTGLFPDQAGRHRRAEGRLKAPASRATAGRRTASG